MPDIDLAIQLLRMGKLVAFPTETVYGLGADATNPQAVERIYQAKGRPPTNPLIVHVANSHIAQRYVTAWPASAQQLADQFWPGPLTLVLPRSESIAPAVSAGLATVGIRVPDHPLALELLQRFDGPIAAPSANRSNRISPTTARHVRDELGDSVDLVLDGGPCAVGIESTVLDLTSAIPTILRPGQVLQQQIEEVIGPVRSSHMVRALTESAVSPGQHEIHYAPQSPAYRFESEQDVSPPPGTVGLLFQTDERFSQMIRMPLQAEDYAMRLYAAMREADALHPPAIYIEMPPAEPSWIGIRDRIHRATQPVER